MLFRTKMHLQHVQRNSARARDRGGLYLAAATARQWLRTAPPARLRLRQSQAPRTGPVRCVPTTPGSLNAVVTVEDWVLVRRGGGSSICGPPLFRMSARHHTVNGMVSGTAEVVRRTPIL